MGKGQVPVLEFVTSFQFGGTERQVVNLARGLDRERFLPHVGCFRRVGEFLGDIERSDMSVAEYGIGSLLSGRALRQAARLASDVRRQKIRLVHTFGFYPNVFAVPAARAGGARAVVASIRDTGDHLTPTRRRLQRSVCRLADHVLANAEAVRQHLLAEGYEPKKVSVIPNGIDLRRFTAPPTPSPVRDELGLPPRAPVVAVLARLTGVKGIEGFLAAATLVAARRPDARFLVVGDSATVDASGRPYRESLEALALRLGLGGRVVFTGFRRDVAALLDEVAVSVLPSLTEGLSNTLLESMAAGRPVVATRVGGNPEAVEDGVSGLIVPPGDPRSMAEAIVALLGDRGRALGMGEAGRRRVEQRFSLEAMVRQTERLYEGLLETAA